MKKIIVIPVKSPEYKKLRVAEYYRVSTLSLVQKRSLDWQIKSYIKMISEQLDWIFASVFYDLLIANAILDSILHHAQVILINGKSYRLKDHLKEDDE